MKRNLKFRYLLWLALPPVFWWAFHRIPFHEVLEILLSLKVSQIAALILINGIILLVFSMRWWSILRSAKIRVPYLPFAGYRLASFGISYFTPGTQFGGEPLQVHFAHTRHKIPSATAAATVSLDKIFELSANFLFLTVGISLILREGYIGGLNNVQGIIPVSILALIPIVYLVILQLGVTPVSRLIALIPSRITIGQRLERILRFLHQTEVQIKTLIKSNKTIIVRSLLISLLIWILLIGEYWFALSILGGRLNLIQIIIALTAARLALLVPIPGGLGALEVGQVAALNIMGVDTAIGISLVLLIRMRDVAFGLTGLALVYTFSRNKQPLPAGLLAGD